MLSLLAALQKVIAKVTDEDLKYLGKILDDWGSGYGDSSDCDYYIRVHDRHQSGVVAERHVASREFKLQSIGLNQFNLPV